MEMLLRCYIHVTAFVGNNIGKQRVPLVCSRNTPDVNKLDQLLRKLDISFVKRQGVVDVDCKMPVRSSVSFPRSDHISEETDRERALPHGTIY